MKYLLMYILGDLTVKGKSVDVLAEFPPGKIQISKSPHLKKLKIIFPILFLFFFGLDCSFYCVLYYCGATGIRITSAENIYTLIYNISSLNILGFR